MTPERFATVRALFDESIALPPDQRDAFLAERCAGDDELRASVKRLLEHDSDQSAALDPSNVRQPLRAALSAKAFRPPERIGTFRVLRLIGRGGMGAVYEAEQDNPRRTVAVKVIRPDFSSPTAMRRFENEAQILGRLQHPGIAHIYEAGIADLGMGPQPFFAMEHIQGSSLLAHADLAQLNRRQRLELFARICEAVDYAHRAGVVHRDLKPGNVLVDPTGQPKILDFGVARATDGDGAGPTIQTLTGQIIGTLAYMSPEQVAGDSSTLDARSDVYSLGVMLFELLSGRLPYDLRNRSIPEAARAIREDDPSRLSSIDSALRGDVDVIVAKALEKDRARRYQTAAELAADIRRFLRDEPIVARPATTMYQIRKFARRHRGLVFGISTAILVLIAALITVSSLAVRETRDRRRAQASESEARWEAYRSCIAAAESALQVHDISRATQALERAQPELRGWEWRHFHAALDQSVQVIDLGFKDHWGAVFTEGDAAVSSLPYSQSNSALRWDSVSAAPLPSGPLHGALTLYLHAPAKEESWNRSVGAEADLLVPLRDGSVKTISRAVLKIAPEIRLNAVTLSPSGRLIAFYTEESTPRAAIWIVDVVDPANPARRIVTSVQNAVLEFSRDDAMLLCANDQDPPQIWNARTGEKLGLVAGHRDRVIAARFSSDGHRLVTASWDATLRLWDTATWETIGVGRGHTDHVEAVAFSPDDRLVASASADGTVRIWDSARLDPLRVLHGHSGRVQSIEFSSDGSQLVSASDDGTARIWSAVPDYDPAVMRGHTGYVYPIAFRPDGNVLASGGWDHAIRLWDVRTRHPLAVLNGHEGNIYQLAWSEDGATLYSSDDLGVLRAWDAGAKQCVGAYQDYQRFAAPPAMMPDGASVAFPCDPNGPLTIWNPKTGETRSVDRSALRTARGRNIAAGGGWWVCPGTTTGYFESMRGGERIAISNVEPAAGPGNFVFAFSADGRRAAYALADFSISVIDLDQRREIGVLRGHSHDLFAIAFSPDGRRLASGGRDEAIHLWDTERLEEVASLRGHTAYVWSLAWSPDGMILASGSGDQTVRIWDTRPRHSQEPTSKSVARQ